MTASETRHASTRPAPQAAPGALPAAMICTAVICKVLELARDATYVTVGLGLLSFQRAQVRRRELERALRR